MSLSKQRIQCPRYCPVSCVTVTASIVFREKTNHARHRLRNGRWCQNKQKRDQNWNEAQSSTSEIEPASMQQTHRYKTVVQAHNPKTVKVNWSALGVVVEVNPPGNRCCAPGNISGGGCQDNTVRAGRPSEHCESSTATKGRHYTYRPSRGSPYLASPGRRAGEHSE